MTIQSISGKWTTRETDVQPKDIRIWEAVAVLTASGTKEPRRFWKFWSTALSWFVGGKFRK
jgi:hypothetical protein